MTMYFCNKYTITNLLCELFSITNFGMKIYIMKQGFLKIIKKHQNNILNFLKVQATNALMEFFI